MHRFADLKIGYKLAFAFCLIIGLGLAGYFNAVRAMQTYVRNSNRVQQVINDGISSAKDVAISLARHGLLHRRLCLQRRPVRL